MRWLALLLLTTFTSGQTLNVPLQVKENLFLNGTVYIQGADRTNEPLSVGVPIADGMNIVGTNTLGLSGATLGQFRILHTWPDGHAKWVLVDTEATLTGCSTVPNTTPCTNTAILLTNSGTGNFGGNVLGVDSSSSTPNAGTITISTGAATFSIKKANFNLFDSVVVGATTLIPSGSSQGLVLIGPDTTATQAAPAAPTVSAGGSGCVAAARNYSVAITYDTANGESVASTPSSIVNVPAGQCLQVNSPAGGTNIGGYYVYVGTSVNPGTQKLATPTPLAIGTNYTEPATGVVNTTGANAVLPPFNRTAPQLTGVGTGCGYILRCATQYSTANDSASTAFLEENGPVKAVVKATANLVNAGHVYMGVTVRLTFWKNSARPYLTVSLRNASVTNPASLTSEHGDNIVTAHKGFAAFYVSLVPSSALNNFILGNDTSTPTTGTVSAGQSAYLYQGYSGVFCSPGTDGADTWLVSDPIFSISKVSGQPTGYICGQGSGSPDAYTFSQDGYIAVNGGTVLKSNTSQVLTNDFAEFHNSAGAGITIVHDWAQGYFPKSMEAQNGGLEIRAGIDPDQAEWVAACMTATVGKVPCQNPYWQAWPQYDINPIVLDFHASTPASVPNDYIRMQYPLVARAGDGSGNWTDGPSKYYNSTGVFPVPIPTPTEEDNYYLSIDTGLCFHGVAPCNRDVGINLAYNPVLHITHRRTWGAGGGGNQSDTRLQQILMFLQRGYTGLYTQGMQTQRFLMEWSLARSDGYLWRDGCSAQSCVQTTLDNDGPNMVGVSTSSAIAVRNLLMVPHSDLIMWIDALHGYLQAFSTAYYLSGNEQLDDWVRTSIVNRYGSLGSNNVSINSGSSTVTCVGCTWTAGNVNQQIVIMGAGPSAGNPNLLASIVGFTSSTQISINTTASRTVSGGTAYWEVTAADLGAPATRSIGTMMTAAAAAYDFLTYTPNPDNSPPSVDTALAQRATNYGELFSQYNFAGNPQVNGFGVPNTDFGVSAVRGIYNTKNTNEGFVPGNNPDQSPSVNCRLGQSQFGTDQCVAQAYQHQEAMEGVWEWVMNRAGYAFSYPLVTPPPASTSYSNYRTFIDAAFGMMQFDLTEMWSNGVPATTANGLPSPNSVPADYDYAQSPNNANGPGINPCPAQDATCNGAWPSPGTASLDVRSTWELGTYTTSAIGVGVQTVTPNSMTVGTLGNSHTISVGDVLDIDAGLFTYEQVTVTATTATTFTASFVNSHATISGSLLWPYIPIGVSGTSPLGYQDATCKATSSCTGEVASARTYFVRTTYVYPQGTDSKTQSTDVPGPASLSNSVYPDYPIAGETTAAKEYSIAVPANEVLTVQAPGNIFAKASYNDVQWNLYVGLSSGIANEHLVWPTRTPSTSTGCSPVGACFGPMHAINCCANPANLSQIVYPYVQPDASWPAGSTASLTTATPPLINTVHDRFYRPYLGNTLEYLPYFWAWYSGDVGAASYPSNGFAGCKAAGYPGVRCKFEQQVDSYFTSLGPILTEFASYMMWGAVYNMLHPPAYQLSTVGISPSTVTGATSVTLTVTSPPAGVTQYRLKQAVGNAIVDNLNYSPSTATYGISPASNQTWWASTEVTPGGSTTCPPVPPATSCVVSGLNAANTYNFAMKAFVPSGAVTTFPLTVSPTGTGTGNVTSNDVPQTINCGWNGSATTGTCTGNYATGTVLTLTATPTSGTFGGWGGACTDTGTCTATINAATSVTATFNPVVSYNWAQQSFTGITFPNLWPRAGGFTPSWTDPILGCAMFREEISSGSIYEDAMWCYNVANNNWTSVFAATPTTAWLTGSNYLASGSANVGPIQNIASSAFGSGGPGANTYFFYATGTYAPGQNYSPNGFEYFHNYNENTLTTTSGQVVRVIPLPASVFSFWNAYGSTVSGQETLQASLPVTKYYVGTGSSTSPFAYAYNSTTGILTITTAATTGYTALEEIAVPVPNNSNPQYATVCTPAQNSNCIAPDTPVAGSSPAAFQTTLSGVTCLVAGRTSTSCSFSTSNGINGGNLAVAPVWDMPTSGLSNTGRAVPVPVMPYEDQADEMVAYDIDHHKLWEYGGPAGICCAPMFWSFSSDAWTSCGKVSISATPAPSCNPWTLVHDYGQVSAPTPNPGQSSEAAMTYIPSAANGGLSNSMGGKVYIYGAGGGSAGGGNVWMRYDPVADQWVSATCSTVPGSVDYAWMGFDTVTKKMYLFEGASGGNPQLGFPNVWVMDPTANGGTFACSQWTLATTTVVPLAGHNCTPQTSGALAGCPPRDRAPAISYDPVRHVFFQYFAYSSFTDVTTPQEWKFDPSTLTWTELSVTGGFLYPGSVQASKNIAYDPTSDSYVLGYGCPIPPQTGSCGENQENIFTLPASVTGGTTTSGTVTVQNSGNGVGTTTSTDGFLNCGATCSHAYTTGTLVTLNSAPNTTTSNFAGWSGPCSGTGSCTFTVSGNVTVTATYTLKTFTLTVSKGGTGAGTVTSGDIPQTINCGATCSAVYNYGTNLTLTGTPTTPSTFSGWQVDGSGTTCPTLGTCTLSMTANHTVIGTFSLPIIINGNVIINGQAVIQ